MIGWPAASDGQWQIGVELAEEEPGARLRVDQIGVLADPAETRLLGQRLFQHRRRVDEDAVAEGADGRGDAVGELLQAAAQHLVVVAAQGVARDVGAGGVARSAQAGLRRGRAGSPCAPRSRAGCPAPARPGGCAWCRGRPCSPWCRGNPLPATPEDGPRRRRAECPRYRPAGSRAPAPSALYSPPGPRGRCRLPAFSSLQRLTAAMMPAA